MLCSPFERISLANNNFSQFFVPGKHEIFLTGFKILFCNRFQNFFDETKLNLKFFLNFIFFFMGRKCHRLSQPARSLNPRQTCGVPDPWEFRPHDLANPALISWQHLREANNDEDRKWGKHASGYKEISRGADGNTREPENQDGRFFADKLKLIKSEAQRSWLFRSFFRSRLEKMFSSLRRPSGKFVSLHWALTFVEKN